MIKYRLKDPTQEISSYNKLRPSVRVFAFNEQKEVAMIHYSGKDAFGFRNHFESIGGGIEENETKEMALKREALEEAGLVLKDIMFLDNVIDEYALIKQINLHFYYYAEIEGYRKSSPTLEESLVQDDLVFKTIEAWIEVLSLPVFGVNALVHQRELLMMKVLQNRLEK